MLSGLISKFESVLPPKVTPVKNEISIPKEPVSEPDENFEPDLRAGMLKRDVIAKSGYTPQARINLLMTPVGKAKSDKVDSLNLGKFAGMYNGDNIKLSDDTLAGKYSPGFDADVLRHEFVHASDSNINPGGLTKPRNLGNSSNFDNYVTSGEDEDLKDYLKYYLSNYKGKDNKAIKDIESYAATGELPGIQYFPDNITKKYSRIYKAVQK